MSQQIPAQADMACSQCGRMFTHADLVQVAGNWVCGDCKPAFLSRLMAGGPGAASPRDWHYGGFWMRFGARFIDSFVLMVPILLLSAVLIPNLVRARGDALNPALAAFTLIFLIFFLAVIAYEVLMLRYWGATVGKMACGLKVVRPDGRSLGWGVSFGRFFMWYVVTTSLPYLNVVLVPISGIMAGVDQEKRALHDRVCDTRVIYKRSAA